MRRISHISLRTARLWRRFGGLVGSVALGVVAASAVAGGVALSGHSMADAKASYESEYGFDRTWNAATRLLRVDLGFKVVERDETTGYMLFEYTSAESGKKFTSGSLEFVGGREPGSVVHVVVQLPEMPRYHEQNLADQLARKLRTEYGDPPKRAPKRAAPPDAGADAGQD